MSTVRSELLDRFGSDVDGAPATVRFRRLEPPWLTGTLFRETPLNRDLPSIQLDVTPAQCEQLARTGSRIHRENKECVVR